MNPDWNLEPKDNECQYCIDEGEEECWCDEDDWEVEDDQRL